MGLDYKIMYLTKRYWKVLIITYKLNYLSIRHIFYLRREKNKIIPKIFYYLPFLVKYDGRKNIFKKLKK